MNEQAQLFTEKDKVREKISIWLESSENHIHTIKELVGNSNDLIIQGNGDAIKVDVSEDCKKITIEDNCSGIPVELSAENGIPNYVAFFETLFGSTKYGQTECTVGTNGVFLCVLTYSSRDIKYTIGRPNGNIYEIEYHKGDRLYDLKIVGTTDKTFTRIEYVLDDEVYDNPIFDINEIEKILEVQSAISNATITLTHKGDTKVYNHNNVYNYFVANLKDTPLVDIISINKTTQQPCIRKKQERLDDIVIDMVFTFTNTTNEITQVELLNGSMLDLHGMPYEGIILGMKNSIHKYLKENNLYEDKEKPISNNDVILSLRHCLDLKSKLTEFTNQTKRSTRSKHYKEVMKTVIEEFMNVYFIENKREANLICNQILLNKRVSESAEKTRNNLKKKLSKKVDNINNRIKGFVDCELKKGGELFLCEGDSAKGSIFLARDSYFQAIYPLRGKIINALKSDDKQLFSNEEIIDMIRLFGCGVEYKSKYTKGLPKFNLDNLRFDKIICTSDSDADGRQINALILTDIYKICPSLITGGYVYIAQTPLFQITVSDDEKYYAFSTEEKDEIVSKLNKKVDIHRLKGLAEINKDIMYETCCNPETRILQKVTVSDIEEMMKSFEIWMDEDVKYRKEIIQDNLNKYLIEPPIYTVTEEKDISDIIKDNMMEYSAEVIFDRAIVSIESGLKPSQQKILWAMRENNRTKLTKSQRIVGDVTPYHEHGSCYPTVVNMCQEDRHILPLIFGEGNFGQYTSKDIMYGSERYTNVKLTELALDGLREVDKNYVEMINTYDNKNKMPLYIPNKYPLILTQSSQGMAVGMASKIPSFNLNEVNNAIIKYLSTNEKTLLIPDFATYGEINFDENIINKVNNYGKGSFKLRGKYYFDKNSVIITQVPYGVRREEIIDKILEYIKKNKLKEVIDVKDLTGLKGLKIKIECKKSTDLNDVVNKLYKLTPFETTFNCNMNVLYRGMPNVCGVWTIIDKWLEFRKECIIRSMTYEIRKLANEVEVYEGLKLIFDNLDRVVDIVRFEEQPEIQLQNEFGLNQRQSEYISNMKFINLNKKHIQKSLNKLNDLLSKLNEMKININSDEYIKNIIIKDLEYINSKYVTPRRTEITSFEKVKIEELVEDYNAVCYLTNDGYFKKVRLTANKGNNKLKDGDSVKTILNATNGSEIIFFGEDLNCYKFRLSELEETKLSNMGVYLPNIIDTKIIGMSTTNDLYKYILIIFNNNSIAKISLDSYKTKQNRKVLSKSLANNDVFDIITLEEDKELTITVSDGRTKTINTKDLTLNKSRSSSGSKQINWRNVNIINVDICRNI